MTKIVDLFENIRYNIKSSMEDSMRIIAGIKRGYKLFDFSGQDIRPTTDRVKESMFNLIQDFILDADVLDLFGGSGALTFEAMSRGARSGTIVDIDKNSIAVINKNKDALGFLDVKVLNCDALNFIKTTKDKFSMIFLDPPYNRGFVAPIIEGIVENELLFDDGIIVLESDFSDEHSNFQGLNILKQRKYGRSFVTVYEKG